MPRRNGATEPDEFVIGRSATAPRPGDAITSPPPPVAARPRAKAGRYPDLTANANGAALPKIYPGHRYLRYWYVPAAGVVALLVAIGVVWTGDRLLGGGGDRAEAATGETPVPAGETQTSVASATAATPQPTSAGSTSVPTRSTAPGEIAAGVAVVVAGTGDCLNIRTGSGLSNDVIACVPDGTELTVLGGPVEADSLTWWQVESEQGAGWVASDYLAIP